MMSQRLIVAIAIVFATFATAGKSLQAQHTMPMPQTTKKKPAPKPKPKTKPKAPAPKEKPAAHVMPADTVPMKMDSTGSMKMPTHKGPQMMTGPLGLSMDRMGSGTTWIPDAITLPSRHRMAGKWEIMGHGFVFGQYDHQSGRRGDDQVGSLNWIMIMASRKVAGGHFQARTMLSLDPATVTARGYPLLLQSGEVFEGEPLHDRQHPHDFFMELGALYQREINSRLAWSIYAAPSGEPALGPVAFMHRPSAMDNPAAPLGHHWQDATHVSFGVVTAGIFSKRWQIEASAFNGREPDEHRWDFDPIRLDSYSARVTANPTASLSLAAGYGYLKSPESLHPDVSMHRLTASLLHGHRTGIDRQMSTAIVWGANRHGSESKTSHSILLENETILDTRNSVFGRAEMVQKTGGDLSLDEIAGAETEQFNVGALQVGYIRELTRLRWATLGLGAAGTINFVPERLEDAYGSRRPVGSFIFVRVRPFHLRTSPMGDMK